jgi:hypothetical protein
VDDVREADAAETRFAGEGDAVLRGVARGGREPRREGDDDERREENRRESARHGLAVDRSTRAVDGSLLGIGVDGGPIGEGGPRADVDEALVEGDDNKVNVDCIVVDSDERRVDVDEGFVDGDEKRVDADEAFVDGDENRTDVDEALVEGDEERVNVGSLVVEVDEERVNVGERTRERRLPVVAGVSEFSCNA